ncbi:MAG: hypothetical protein A2Z25_21165 [Planctomycetes bacterium RBG_16_55_9]|nr:MAG: hypothetical protein A2Z25_21165 [Planctomycetes bacterium RBG_16_55_9]
MKSRIDTNAKTLTYFLATTILLVGLSVPRCHADLYSGSITYGDGLFATEAWADPTTTLSWGVTAVDSFWHYEYTFTVPKKDLKHAIIEVSDTFEESDLKNPDPATYELDTYHPGKYNPGLPGDIYGLKFEDFEDDTTMWTWSFDSTRAPVWGDFYAKDGKVCKNYVYAYNSGFLVEPDVETGHISVPDTTTVVPVSPAALLSLIGLSFAGLKLRKLA